ncbi:aminopeptidase [Pseudalkalibacillus hwajinpoensis]|uniref:aminopeptidase n=1 Tax=Guptibacillus hwajinpoensis TaxID=208199 RepID=UPI001CD5D90D|nr:aminopeptidase [Pseudalkalibacillus hwajinpoensis]MCA0990519.1 aminopeptidase [Pseudalkalibacillus hwajinpoensis]
MRDERLSQLAKTLVHHSIEVKIGERVMVTGHQIAKPLIREIIKEIYAADGVPFVELRDDEIDVHLAEFATKEQAEIQKEWYAKQLEDVQSFIHIRAEENDATLSELASDAMKLYGEVFKEIDHKMVNERKWVLLDYPTPAAAQKAKMGTLTYQDYLFEVCSLDYKRMAEKQQPLFDLMEKTDQVKIIAPGTDLSFSILNIPTIASHGKKNIPDGEVFTSPVKESVNGIISFNTPCSYQGITFHNVKLTLEKGKIVHAEADQTDKLNEILNLDEGARYIGEFAIGLNPLINHPVGNTLFDEKINGSIHFTPGQAYDNADNGNRSMIHWDMVLILRKEFGGGELYFDGQLIQKDGVFVTDDLIDLNPENLNQKEIVR